MLEGQKMATDDPKFTAWLLRDEAKRAADAGEAIRMSPALALVIADQLEAILG
jgi:hypothetical protein